MQITGIHCGRLRARWAYTGPISEGRVLRPVDIYPDFRAQEPSGPSPMWPKAHPGCKGQTRMAFSKVDLALWELKGKLLGAPVYQLLGGPTRPKIRAYASMLGYPIEPERAAERAAEVVAQGDTACTWFTRNGPAEGQAGMRRNLDLIRAIRQSVGLDGERVFDAWSAWDVPYTRRMAERAAECRPWWFEEPVLADRIAEYAELRRTVRGAAIVGGEHEYTRTTGSPART